MEKKIKIYVISTLLIIVISIPVFLNLNNLVTNNNSLSNTSQHINQNAETYNLSFNGTRAFTYLKDQVDIGFRPPNSTEIELTRVLIVKQLLQYNWTIEFNNFTYKGVASVNILAFPGNSDHHNVTLFGAHYDTRWWADRDTNVSNKHQPVLGANDGASGVAVLMEFAQIFEMRTDIALLFIDAEDQGDINGWEYCAGTYEFVLHNVLDTFFTNGKSDIRIFILFDMIGDWQLNIKKEGFSNVIVNNQIWSMADKLNYGTTFTNSPGYYMIDDHKAFLDAGIPAVDLIDFDYTDANGMNLHHTTHDTLQYVSANSLAIVGQTIEYWLIIYSPITLV